MADGAEVVTSAELPFYAGVAGIVDGRVLLSTGDGASAPAGLWDPASGEGRRHWM